MNKINTVYLKETHELLKALLVDDAKNLAMIDELLKDVKQLQAKNRFRLALINQLIEKENK